MTTRRSVIAAGAVLAAAPAAAKARTVKVRFDAAIYDGRFAESRKFAAAMRRAGVATYDVSEIDIGQIWYGELSALTHEAPFKVCGLTAHTDLFISKSLARERGARQRYEGRHDSREPGPICHELDCATAAEAVTDGGRDWGTTLAEALLAGAGKKGKDTVLTSGARPVGAAATLFSWVLA